jgi:hypothetical protein
MDKESQVSISWKTWRRLSQKRFGKALRFLVRMMEVLEALSPTGNGPTYPLYGIAMSPQKRESSTPW